MFRFIIRISTTTRFVCCSLNRGIACLFFSVNLSGIQLFRNIFRFRVHSTSSSVLFLVCALYEYLRWKASLMIQNYFLYATCFSILKNKKSVSLLSILFFQTMACKTEEYSTIFFQWIVLRSISLDWNFLRSSFLSFLIK